LRPTTRNQRRLWNLAGFGIVVALMAYALYAQHVQGLDACPLCIFQRVGMIALGLVFLLAAIHGAGRLGSRVYLVLGLGAAIGGGAVSARHVYLQSLPADRVPACGPGLDYMLEAFPLLDAVRLVFEGSGECAVVNWSFLGLSMPAWVLLWFGLLAALLTLANTGASGGLGGPR
jgi:disulfide bond formation protein DsbB